MSFLIQHYEQMITQGVPPEEWPLYIKLGSYANHPGGQTMKQVFAEMRAEQQRVTHQSLRQEKNRDEKLRKEGKEIEQFREFVQKVKFRLILLQMELRKNLSSTWSWIAFKIFIDKHISNSHTCEDILAVEKNTARLLRSDAAQNNEQHLAKQKSFVEPSIAEAPKEKYNDLQSAIVYFKRRETEILLLDIEPDEKEMLLLRLAEKRSHVLDEYI